jgi:phosphopentomutase
MIVYTSSDSVLQIAAHEKYFGLDELYRVCEITRKICMDPKYMVGRIIARPFIGEDPSSFERTSNRHDYAVSPSDTTALNILKENNLDVISVGKIKDIFNNSGITESYKSKNNDDGMRITIDLLKKDFTGLCFVNLVDFDSLYGHRRDPLGYEAALEDFDSLLNEMLSKVNQDDLVIITADHGNDPTWIGTDHTREYVPLLVYSPNINNINLGKRETFGDIGKTILDNFGLSGLKIGKSFLDKI